MSVETLKTISLVAYAISAFFLVITVWIFFKLKIGEILGEITGITRRKAIKDLRSQSSEEKKGFYQASYAKGKNTEKTGKDGSRKLGGHSGKIRGNSVNLEPPTTALEVDEGGQTVLLSEAMVEESAKITAEVRVITEIILCDTDEFIA